MACVPLDGRLTGALGAAFLEETAMLPLLVMACYFYGTRPLMVALWSVAACKLADSVCCLIARHKLMLGVAV